MKTADIHIQLQALISSCIDEGDYDPAEDYIKDPFCRRTMHTASLAINEIDTLRARVAELEAAIYPLVRIADAYDDNALDDEARKFWGMNDEHENKDDPARIELYSGRGGRQLLTLADCLTARTATRAANERGEG